MRKLKGSFGDLIDAKDAALADEQPARQQAGVSAERLLDMILKLSEDIDQELWGAEGSKEINARGRIVPLISAFADALLATAPPPVDANVNSQIMVALEESIKLQSHYAGILNNFDGGKRIQFSNAAEWITRMKEIGKLATAPPEQAAPIDFHKPGEIPVNAPTCDKCGKIFLDCKCSQDQPEQASNFPCKCAEPYEGARILGTPRRCERCGGLVELQPVSAGALSAEQLAAELDLFKRRLRTSEECRDNLFAAMQEQKAVLAAHDQAQFDKGWQLAHELAKCGHPRACYQDSNWPKSEGDEKCIVCEALAAHDQKVRAEVRGQRVTLEQVRNLPRAERPISVVIGFHDGHIVKAEGDGALEFYRAMLDGRKRAEEESSRPAPAASKPAAGKP